jgi:hypothetical protein
MQRNEKCKPGDEHPPATFYHRDNLDCDRASCCLLSTSTLSIIITLLFIFR